MAQEGGSRQKHENLFTFVYSFDIIMVCVGLTSLICDKAS